MSIPYSRFIFQPIPWYSFLIVSGALIAIILASREEKRAGLKKDTVLDLALWLLPCGIIGARIYYVVFSWDSFRNDFWSVFRVWEGGIAIYGAIIAGFLVIAVFSRRRKISLWALCDIIAPGLVLAQAIGRWGNYFNMEAYGAEITDPALQFFPLGVQIASGSGYVWHMATFFYESLWDFLVFLFLMAARRKWLRREGDVFCFYAFLYGCGRLVVEDLRMDSLYAASSVRVSQLLSVVICVVLLIRYLRFAYADPRPYLIIGVCLCCGALLFALPVLAYCLNLVIHPAEMPLGGRLLLLGLYAVFNIATLFILYGPSGKEEVRYAIHAA